MSIWRSIQLVSFCFDLFRFVLFRFDLFRSVSICSVSFRFVSFRFDLFRFVPLRFYFVSHFTGTPFFNLDLHVSRLICLLLCSLCVLYLFQCLFISFKKCVGSIGGRVVKLLACGARRPGFASRPRHLNFQRLVISCFQVEIWLKDC